MKRVFSTLLFSMFFITLSFTQDEKLEVELQSAGNTINQGMYLTRNAGYLRFINGTTLNGDFQARISGLADSDISPGLALIGTPSLIDTNSTGILLRAGETSSILDGNLLEIANFTTSVLTVNSTGYLGIGTTDAKSNLHVADGDIFIEDMNAGIIMKASDGSCWRYQPDTNGVLNGTSVSCPN